MVRDWLGGRICQRQIIGGIVMDPKTDTIEKIKAGETVCEHMNRPFDCDICFPKPKRREGWVTTVDGPYWEEI